MGYTILLSVATHSPFRPHLQQAYREPEKESRDWCLNLTERLDLAAFLLMADMITRSGGRANSHTASVF